MIGHPVSHSFSPDFFNSQFKRDNIDAYYGAFDLSDIAMLPQLMKRHPGLKGLNVTLPHKEKVIPFLQELTDAARDIGAVNCIAIHPNKLLGHNTDWIGFLESLKPLLKPWHQQALILGTGGASKAVQYALRKNNIPFQLVSRNATADEINYAALDRSVLKSHTLLINTTPLGMFPDIHSCPPIPYELLTPQHLLYDLIYTPAETLFLQQGKARGATIKNGLEMLEIQARESWRIWTKE